MHKVVAIVGTTAVGKSKLAVELAKRFNGEVINADAMQMYQGLDIATNKIPVDEMEGIPHHLLGHLPFHAEAVNVHQFVHEASLKIKEIHARHKLPIVVGGTMYYVQSLLFNNSLALLPDVDGQSDSDNGIPPMLRDEISLVLASDDSHLMHSLLEKLDPRMAERWHKNDIRKIRRSIEYFVESDGRHLHSDHLAESAATQSSRFDSILLTVECRDRPLLNRRLDDRVDEMVARGLAVELDQAWVGNGLDQLQSVDFTRGILQTIGFKEFFDGSSGERWPVGDAVESIKVATRQYAWRQERWLRNRLMNAVNAVGLPFVALNCCDFSLGAWTRDIMDKATQAVESFLLEPRPAACKQSTSKANNEWKKHHCPSCDRTVNGDHEWHEHLKSRKHKRVLELQSKSDQWQRILQARLAKKG